MTCSLNGVGNFLCGFDGVSAEAYGEAALFEFVCFFTFVEVVTAFDRDVLAGDGDVFACE